MKQKEAWKKCKMAAVRGFEYFNQPITTIADPCRLKGEIGQYPPIHEVRVPHHHGLAHEGDTIPIYHQLPAGASAANPVPAMIVITGLDGYRTELAVWAEGWRRNNVAFICLEIPGTGDCPADAKDPTSPDRLFESLLEWIGHQEGIDSKKLCVWAFSTGGYYAIRLAHTHPDRFAGVVALGGGCHYMFDPKWLDEVNHLEYPFEYVCCSLNIELTTQSCQHSIVQMGLRGRR
jgi:hypothetical protein